MSRTTYDDLEVVHRYMDEIATFIQTIVHKDSEAIMLACQVFEECKKKEDTAPFATEALRLQWLQQRSQQLTTAYMHRKKREGIQMRAIRMAIHDSN